VLIEWVRPPPGVACIHDHSEGSRRGSSELESPKIQIAGSACVGSYSSYSPPTNYSANSAPAQSNDGSTPAAFGQQSDIAACADAKVPAAADCGTDNQTSTLL
jgi:hypothetical protein